ncbi:MAG: OmpA family protein [Polyangiaceae bacterium]|nr:OmpA family protein [Polyangiaceae bacterium]
MRSLSKAHKCAVGAAVGAALTLVPNLAAAQGRGFYVDRLIMAGAPNDAIGIWRPETSDKTRFFGQFGVGFSLNPLRAENYIKGSSAGVANPIDTQTAMYLSLGVEFLKRVQILALMPAILGQTTNPTVGDLVSPPVSAPMDLRLEVRAVLFRNDARTFRLGANAAVFAPTGDQGAWAGEGAASGLLGVAAEYDLKSVYIDLNTGFLFRPRSDLNSKTFVVGNDWRYGLGVYAPLRGGTFRVGASVFGSASIEGEAAFKASNSTLEWMAEGKMTLDEKKRLQLGFGGGTRLTPGYAPDLRLVATIGYHLPIEDTVPKSPPKKFKVEDTRPVDTDKDGLPDDIDLCPNEPEDHKMPNPDDGCAAPPDRDGDGIPDSRDACPDKPEDFDKIDDQDGCPEDDFDKDGVGDAVDHCPKEPGEPSAEKDKNGCPVFIRRLEGSTEIQILKQVQFATGSAKILSNSFKILDEVVKLMTINKDVKLVAIEGHTDDRGPVKMNEKLSDDRAHSVRQYIIDKGIHPDRLTAQGFGPHKPIADNNTTDGRQKNRRVEFHIRDNAAPAQPDPNAQPAPQ